MLCPDPNNQKQITGVGFDWTASQLGRRKKAIFLDDDFTFSSYSPKFITTCPEQQSNSDSILTSAVILRF